MAEILIRIKNRTRINSEVQERKAKRGTIMVVRPDGWGWGTSEGLPNFAVIKIPGLNPDLIKKFEDSHDVNGVRIKNRKWEILVDHANIPAWVKTDIQNTGSVTVTKAQIKNFVHNLITDEYWT